MPNLEKAYQWVIDTCNNPNVGYSQPYRTGRKVNGKYYYDCSSLLSKALTVGGFFKKNPWFTTRSMKSYLKKSGWKKVDIHGIWKKGDILWRTGHTEMVYKGGNASGYSMGAHSSRYAFKNQVSINNDITKSGNWSELWRYANGVDDTYTQKWVAKNDYLTNDNMENNAYIFYSVMSNYGYDLKSICAMLGNISVESGINPALWQSRKYGDMSVGYGLVQWTPASKYINWAKSNNYDEKDGYGQCVWLDKMTDKNQWIKTTSYPLTWKQFKENSKHKSIDYLTKAFLKNFERAGIEKTNQRIDYAKRWYNYLKNKQPFSPTTNKGVIDNTEYKWWMYLSPY